MTTPWAPRYTHLTADLPPIAFRARTGPYDFRVEELPEREPCGEGTHLWLTVEKVGIPTEEAARRIARALDVAPNSVGYAGRKDARAVCVQRLSVEHVDEGRARGLAPPGVRVLDVARDRAKLRRGALLGNRFQVVLRELADDARPRVEGVLREIERHGLPNYFGPQRFGRTGQAHELGALLVAGDPLAYLRALVSERHAGVGEARAELERALDDPATGARRAAARRVAELPPELAAVARQLARRPRQPESAVHAVPRATLRFHLNALQSRVFNRVLATRLAAGAIEVPEAGDVAFEHATGRTFEVEVPTAHDARRAAAFELSPSGPLPGGDNLCRAGRPAAWEARAVEEEGLDVRQLGRLGPRLAPRGARRPLRVPVRELSARFGAGTCTLTFVLPAGSFATALLEELGKDLLEKSSSLDEIAD